MSRFNLALRLFWRDSRSGELTLLILALIIAVSSSSAIALFSERLQRTMNLQAAELLGADLVIASPELIAPEWLEQAKLLNLKTARTSEFPSVLIEHDELLLASIKAISDAYPLRGFLRISDGGASAETIVHHGPEPGTAWLEKRLLSALKLKLGDTLTVGERPLLVTKIITYEPDKKGDFFSFSPRVMINDLDLQATGVIQPGSQVHYYFQFVGDTNALVAFKNWLKPQLNPSQRIMDSHNNRPELSSALDRAERYLSLSSILVILIAGVAIAMATNRYTERHFNATALLRCLGLKQREILWLYSSQFMVLGLLASTIGTVLGYCAQVGLFYILRELLPQPIAPPGLDTLFFGFVIGMVMLLGFALPPLLRLKHVSALRVLRRELEPKQPKVWLAYGFAISLISLLIWKYTDDLKMTVSILGLGLLTLMLLGLIIMGLLKLMHKRLDDLSLLWRLGLQGLLRNHRASISQILAFSITLVAMLLSFNVRNDIINDWQQQLPKEAPNYFALNIFPNQVQDFKEEFEQQHITGSEFYPIVRGRLTAVNEMLVQKRASKDSQGDNAIHRDLSLTWAATLPYENKLQAGSWWVDAQPGLVSIEQKLAESLSIKVGDSLTFTVGSQQFHATAVNIRSLRWDTMKPNFYMVFSPGTLEAFPSTFITSFYLAESQKELLNVLVKKFPSTTILEVDLILQQFKTLLTQLTQAINFLLYFALIAGFIVLLTAVYATLDQRIYEGALMRTLGASRRLLRTAQLIEFSALGLVSGVMAMMMSELMLFALYTQVLHISYHPSFYLWLLVPVTNAVLISIVGCLGVRQVLNKPPLQVLRAI
jgi:putative ABC transport system permease protein